MRTIFLAVLLVAAACNPNVETSDQIQLKILNDVDFRLLLQQTTEITSEIKQLYKDGLSQTKIDNSLEEDIKELQKTYARLESRYVDFEKNAASALENYPDLAVELHIEVKNSKTLFDAASVCGGCRSPREGLGCLTGCNFSTSSCLNRGGSIGMCSGIQSGLQQFMLRLVLRAIIRTIKTKQQCLFQRLAYYYFCSQPLSSQRKSG